MRSGTEQTERDDALASGDLQQLHSLHARGINLLDCTAGAVREAIKGGHWAALNFWFQAGGQVAHEILADDVAKAENPDASDPVVAIAKRHLVETVNHAANRSLPSAGPRWTAYSLWARAVIRHLETTEAAVRFAQDSYGHGGFESRFGSDATQAYGRTQEAHLSGRFPQFAQHLCSFTESELSDPATTGFLDGRRISAPLYANATFFLECHARLHPYPRSVCEIGGGYGGPARLWLTNSINRPGRYVIVDLPESLFFSEVFLKREFGASKIHYITSPAPLPASILDEATAVLCPVPFIAALDGIGFDLAYNTLSMQEMSDAYVEFYGAWLDRAAVKTFYSFNYAAQPADEHPESANWGVPRLSRLWHPLWIENYAAGPSPAVHILAQRHAEPDASMREARRVLDNRLGRPSDAATFTEMLMAARLLNDAAMSCAVIRKALADFPAVPREVMLLLRWLPDQDGAKSLNRSDRALLETAEAAVRQHGEAKAMAAPFLETIRTALPE